MSHGLVDAQPAGNAVLYTLNRDHLLADAVLSAVTARQRLVDRIRDQLADWSLPAVHVSLFGSLARGDAGNDSDVDMLVVRPDIADAGNQAWASQLGNLGELVYRMTGNTLSWFETTRAGLLEAVDAGEPVVASWRSDSVHIAGARLSTLLDPVQEPR